jgi:hypothetical protein
VEGVEAGVVIVSCAGDPAGWAVPAGAKNLWIPPRAPVPVAADEDNDDDDNDDDDDASSACVARAGRGCCGLTAGEMAVNRAKVSASSWSVLPPMPARLLIASRAVTLNSAQPAAALVAAALEVGLHCGVDLPALMSDAAISAPAS